MSFKPQAMEPFYPNFVENTEQPVPMDLINSYSCPNELDEGKCNFSNVWNSPVEAINESTSLVAGELKSVETSSMSAAEENLVDLTNQSVENINNSMGMVEPETMSTIDIVPENPTPSSLNFDSDSASSVKTGLDDFLAGVNESFNSSVNKGETAVKSFLNKITSSITSVTTSASETVDNAQSLANDKVSNLSSDLKEASSKASAFAVDLLRHTIVVVEDSLSNGASSFVYYYASAKERLPPETKDALTLYEEITGKALKPAGAALQQVSLFGMHVSFMSHGLFFDDPQTNFCLYISVSSWHQ